MKKSTHVGIVVLTLTTMAAAFVGCSTSTEKQAAAAATPATRALLTPGPSASGAVVIGSGTTTCVGSYTALAKITNSATGTVWFTPPNGTTNCTITDSSGLASPYESVVVSVRKRDLNLLCGTNTLSFPAQSTNEYKFLIYVKNTPPPPANGDILTLDVQWTP